MSAGQTDKVFCTFYFVESFDNISVISYFARHFTCFIYGWRNLTNCILLAYTCICCKSTIMNGTYTNFSIFNVFFFNHAAERALLRFLLFIFFIFLIVLLISEHTRQIFTKFSRLSEIWMKMINLTFISRSLMYVATVTNWLLGELATLGIPPPSFIDWHYTMN